MHKGCPGALPPPPHALSSGRLGMRWGKSNEVGSPPEPKPAPEMSFFLVCAPNTRRHRSLEHGRRRPRPQAQLSNPNDLGCPSSRPAASLADLPRPSAARGAPRLHLLPTTSPKGRRKGPGGGSPAAPRRAPPRAGAAARTHPR